MSYSRRMVGLKLWVMAKANTRNAAFVQPSRLPSTGGKRLSDLGLFLVRRRNRQSADHLAQLLARGDVAEADFAELLQVEQGEALGKEFAVDHALAEAGDDTESDAPG